jgi:riboflavin kinase/FMN adenylyltransferase
MRVVRHLEACTGPRRRVVLTLGNFDGVHLGHRAILDRTSSEARRRGVDSAVFTFEPHPVAVLAPDRAPPRLQTLHDRLACFREAGMDVVVVQRFTKAFSRHAADAFVADVLLAGFAVTHVVVGHRVSFGRGRSGDASTLRRLGEHHGFSVESIGSVAVDGDEASSTAVRAAVQSGDARRAARLLGRPWSIRGRVGRGDGRGRTIGFPTANVHLRSSLVLPPDGVYAAWVEVGAATYGGVLNLGMRPTFAGRARTLEVHVLDFDGDLYGAWLVVHFVERLRGEERFDGPDALRSAIAKDVARAGALLGGTPGGQPA